MKPGIYRSNDSIAFPIPFYVEIVRTVGGIAEYYHLPTYHGSNLFRISVSELYKYGFLRDDHYVEFFESL